MLSALLFQAMNPLVCDAHASHQECRRQNQEEDVCECCRDEFVHGSTSAVLRRKTAFRKRAR
jgi:hypothetical protein